MEGKSIVVAGAGTGIGRACALLYAQEGAQVAIIGRHQSILKETVALGRARGHAILPVKADLSKSADVKKVLQVILKAHDRIDVFHHNAGYWEVKPLAELNEKSWVNMHETNAKTAFLTTQEVVPYFVKQGGGVLTITAAIHGTFTHPKGMLHYISSKAALVAFSKGLASELYAQRIRVNCICPGTVSHHLHTSKGQLKTDLNMIRHGVPEDIAYAALYLASDEASWVTGTAMVIDGGASLGLDPSKKNVG